MKKSILVMALTALSVGSQADVPKPPPVPPPGPLIMQHADAMAAWVITLQQDSPSSSNVGSDTPSPKPKTAWGSPETITKTDSIIRQTMVDDQSQTWEFWYFASDAFLLYPNKKDMIGRGQTAGTSDRNFTDFSTTDFPDFSWINASCYLGIKQFNDTSCLAFRGLQHSDSTTVNPVTTLSSSDQDTSDAIRPEAALPVIPVPGRVVVVQAPPIEYIAYVDKKSRLPVGLKTSSATHVYAFQPPPVTMLQLPAPIAAALKKGDDLVKLTTRPTVRPY